MKFVLSDDTRGTHDKPVTVLKRLRWDDHGHKNTFSAVLHKTRGSAPLHLGPVKILQKGRKSPALDDTFDMAPESCCSIGQSVDYYDRLGDCGELGTAVLRGLRDLVEDPPRSSMFDDEPGFDRSLLRLPSARYLLQRAQGALPDSLTVSVTTALRGLSTQEPTTLHIPLNPKNLGGRLGVLAGVNGAGKTQMLSRVAHAFAVDDELFGAGERPAVSRVVALSFSAFDQFELPKPPVRDFYWYCGLRRRVRRSDFSEPVAIGVQPEDWGLDKLYGEVCDLNRRSRWKKAMVDLGLARAIPQQGARLLPRVRTLGAGHKLACLAFTHLLARLRARTLILFDEPELHTHPKLLSSMIRVLAQLLDEYGSFAMISTHSPIVLQEVPSSQIRVFHRGDSGLRISGYPGKSFGEDLNEIVRVGFGVDPDKRGYVTMLTQEAANLGGAAAVREQHSGSLGLAAQFALSDLEEDEAP